MSKRQTYLTVGERRSLIPPKGQASPHILIGGLVVICVLAIALGWLLGVIL